MNWSAIGALAALMALPIAWYVGTRRSKARIYGRAPFPAPFDGCQIVIENGSDTPVHITRATVLWPRSFRLGVQRYGEGSPAYEPGPALPIAWSRSIDGALTVDPGKSESWDFRVLSSRPDMRISCLISLHVDEARWMQISKIRVVKVVQHAVASDSHSPVWFIG